MTKKRISLAISLLVVVISLTGVAFGSGAPTTITPLTRYTPGFAGAPGKMARDAAGNFYVTDFWGKGIVKLDRFGANPRVIPTQGRPSAVAVLPDNRLVVAIAIPKSTDPKPYIAFYDQSGNETKFGAPVDPIYRPTAITVDAAGYIYVVDSGDNSDSTTVNVPKVRVYDAAGQHVYAFGERTSLGSTADVNTANYQYKLKQPSGIAYEKLANQIVVVDTLNGRLMYYSAYVNGTGCVFQKFIGTTAGLTQQAEGVGKATAPTTTVTFGNIVDVAFEYDAVPSLQRLYVAERGRGEIGVLDALTSRSTKYISGEKASRVLGADLKLPNAVLFEQTAGGGGVLYTNSAATSVAANVFPISINNGQVPVPSFTLAFSPVPSPTVQSTTINLSGTSTATYPVSCSVNGGVDISATGSSNWSISNFNLAPNATNYILCKSSDGSVTSYAEATVVTTDILGQAPTVIIDQPVAGSYTNAASLTVSGTSDTANATVHVTDTQSGASVYTLTNAAKKWSAVVNLVAGSNDIAVDIWTPGSAAGSASSAITADYSAPAITPAFIADGKTTNNAVQNIGGIVTEAHLKSIEVNGVEIPSLAKVSLVGNDTYFSVPVTLVRGSNTLTVRATDLAGNVSALISRTVTLTPELPGLTVAAPADNSYLPGVASAAANGTADAGITSVTAAGVPAVPAAGAWATASNFTVNSGINAYAFSATDGSSTVTEKRAILNDAAYAQLAITEPPADLAINTAAVVIKGKVAAGSAAPTISIDGAVAVAVDSYTVGTGAFTHSVNFTAQGVHIVKVIANAATTAVRNIVYDTTAPKIAIQADSKTTPSAFTGALETNTKMLAVKAYLNSVLVPVPASVVTFDAYNASAGEAVWHANLAGYTYDTITFTAATPAGTQKDLTFASGIPTGDVDGDGTVRLSDALACLRHVAQTEILSGNHKFQADVGSLVQGRAAQDGDVDITDAVLILNKSYGLLSF